MLLSTYSMNVNNIHTLPITLSDPKSKLLYKLQSKSRFMKLIDVLPENWEDIYTICFYDDPNRVTNKFSQFKCHKYDLILEERIIDHIIISDKNEAIPGKYDEYLRRDCDYLIEENKWKIDDYSTEYIPPSFHVDHKLIWTTRERKVDINSTINISDVPYKYTINVYIPDPQILLDVENLKLNNI